MSSKVRSCRFRLWRPWRLGLGDINWPLGVEVLNAYVRVCLAREEVLHPQAKTCFQRLYGGWSPPSIKPLKTGGVSVLAHCIDVGLAIKQSKHIGNIALFDFVFYLIQVIIQLHCVSHKFLVRVGRGNQGLVVDSWGHALGGDHFLFASCACFSPF